MLQGETSFPVYNIKVGKLYIFGLDVNPVQLEVFDGIFFSTISRSDGEIMWLGLQPLFPVKQIR